jgi:hypothetical protein
MPDRDYWLVCQRWPVSGAGCRPVNRLTARGRGAPSRSSVVPTRPGGGAPLYLMMRQTNSVGRAGNKVAIS